jgi:transcriptional regulator with XRE-family HTH domain
MARSFTRADALRERLRAYSRQHQLTQVELAARFDVMQSYVSRLLNGHNDVHSLAIYERTAHLLDRPLGTLIEELDAAVAAQPPTFAEVLRHQLKAHDDGGALTLGELLPALIAWVEQIETRLEALQPRKKRSHKRIPRPNTAETKGRDAN